MFVRGDGYCWRIGKREANVTFFMSCNYCFLRLQILILNVSGHMLRPFVEQ
jgi:hypothetical protein